MRLLPLAALVVALGACSTLNETSFVSEDPAVRDVLDGRAEIDGPLIAGDGERVIWTDRL